MTIDQLLEQWKGRKASRRSFRLTEPFIAECEFKKLTNHGQFAFVRFACSPNKDFCFQVARGVWPNTLEPSYIANLDSMIAEGIVDVLAAELSPHTCCNLVLDAVKWHDIDSSEAAFYEATRGAMRRLVENGAWEIA